MWEDYFYGLCTFHREEGDIYTTLDYHFMTLDSIYSIIVGDHFGIYSYSSLICITSEFVLMQKYCIDI